MPKFLFNVVLGFLANVFCTKKKKERINKLNLGFFMYEAVSNQHYLMSSQIVHLLFLVEFLNIVAR